MKKPEQIQREIFNLIDDLENLKDKSLTRERTKILFKIQNLRQIRLLIESGISEKILKDQLTKLIEKRAFIKKQVENTKNKILEIGKNPKIEVKKILDAYNIKQIETQISNLNYILENENN